MKAGVVIGIARRDTSTLLNILKTRGNTAEDIRVIELDDREPIEIGDYMEWDRDEAYWTPCARSVFAADSKYRQEGIDKHIRLALARNP